MATARKGLNDAMYGEGLITLNPAVKVELPPEVRPKPLVWTEARVARWLETGEIPGNSVSVKRRETPGSTSA
ncbi:hypothetical protein ACWGE0_41035 [Lentzea sp. NPDC054927]